MSIEVITLLMFGAMFLLLAFGLPLAFTLGCVSLIFAFFLWGPESLHLLASRTIGVMFNYVLIAVPLFMFMASILEVGGLADDLYEAIYVWTGAMRGGLAIGTIIICTAIAAMSGVSAAGVLAMGVLALPAMLERKYDKGIALGSIAAGGALGQLIPPSLLMILYGAVSGVSVGKLFMGGVFPGLLLATLFILYIGIRSLIQKELCPSMPETQRMKITLKEKVARIKSILFPSVLIIAVLGSIFTGIATPTEAAGVGALGSLVGAVMNRRLSWESLKRACFSTLKTTSMCMWIIIGSNMFVSVYFAFGGDDFIKATLGILGYNRWIVIICMQIILIILGAFMDTTGIVMLCTPLFIPIIKELNFDPIWFGVLFIVNLEMAYLTPPFGYNLFYLKAVAPENISMTDIYRSIWPFVVLQLTGLVLCMLFPQIILMLPNLLIK